MSKLIPINLYEKLSKRIYIMREERVMLDTDLAGLYGVTTYNLNKAVKRNLDRFPKDFLFQLSPEEAESLRFQIGISKKGRGGRRYLPHVFTEQGVAMLTSVLNSKRAIHVNIQIMRAFVNIRKFEGTHKDLVIRIDELEKKYDAHFQIVFKTLKALLDNKPRDGHGKRFEV